MNRWISPLVFQFVLYVENKSYHEYQKREQLVQKNSLCKRKEQEVHTHQISQWFLVAKYYTYFNSFVVFIINLKMEQINTTRTTLSNITTVSNRTPKQDDMELKFENPTGSFWLRGKRAKTFRGEGFLCSIAFRHPRGNVSCFYPITMLTIWLISNK